MVRFRDIRQNDKGDSLAIDCVSSVFIDAPMDYASLCCTHEVLEDYACALRALGITINLTENLLENKTSYQDDEEEYLLGRVIKLDRSYPLVMTEKGAVRAEHAADLKKNASSLAAVGDWVVLVAPKGQDKPRIVDILPRRTLLKRKEISGNEQVLATNIDIVILVLTASGPGLDIRHLERLLVVAHESGARAAIVITKADKALNLSADLESARLRASVADIPVVVESAVTGEGVAQVRELIPAGTCAVLLGKSGVGKSTLINALIGSDVVATGAVRARDDKGRHTTVAREMLQIPDGGVIIDTPGLRSIQIWDVSEGLNRAYQDVLSFAGECRFRDCTHTNEPGCAVVEAVQKGELAVHRLESYRALFAEAAQAAQAAERASWSRGSWRL